MKIDRATAYQFQGLGQGAAGSVSVIKLTWGDSGETKVFAPVPHLGTREFYSTGVLPLPDGCGAMVWGVTNVRQMATVSYPLIAVLEEHYYDESCVGANFADTTMAIFFDARKLDRQLLVLEDALFKVETGNCVSPPPGVECWTADTVTVRHTTYTVDGLGIRVSQKVLKGRAGMQETLYSWNHDSTALVPNR